MVVLADQIGSVQRLQGQLDDLPRQGPHSALHANSATVVASGSPTAIPTARVRHLAGGGEQGEGAEDAAPESISSLLANVRRATVMTKPDAHHQQMSPSQLQRHLAPLPPKKNRAAQAGRLIMQKLKKQKMSAMIAALKQSQEGGGGGEGAQPSEEQKNEALSSLASLFKK